jgi:hypothetical protein
VLDAITRGKIRKRKIEPSINFYTVIFQHSVILYPFPWWCVTPIMLGRVNAPLLSEAVSTG